MPWETMSTHVVHHLTSVTKIKVIVTQTMNVLVTFNVVKIIVSPLFQRMLIVALVSSLCYIQFYIIREVDYSFISFTMCLIWSTKLWRKKRTFFWSFHIKNILYLETANIYFPNFLSECIGSWECNADPKRGVCDTINNICVGKLHFLIKHFRK